MKHKISYLKDIKSPIFVIGMGRSGTSVISEAIAVNHELGWLSQYLNRFPRYEWLSILNRLAHIPTVGSVLYGKKLQNNDFTSLIKKYFPYSAEAWSYWELHFGKRFLFGYLHNEEATIEEAINTNQSISDILKYSGRNRFFTKFTGPPRIRFLNSVFPGAYFIHVVRDPRAVVSSLLQVPFWSEGGGLDNPWWDGLTDENWKEWHSEGRTPAGLAAVQWKQVVEMVRVEKVLIEPDKYIEIKYEDFVQSPHQSINSIFDLVKLPNCQKVHRYIESNNKKKI